MKKHVNAILLSFLLGLGLIYLTGIVIMERSNAREIHYLRHEAVLKDSIRDERLEVLETALVAVTQSLDSLEDLYIADSTAWHQERAQLTGSLWRQQKQAKTFKQAYENTKQALETQTMGRPPAQVPAPRRVYDLSPVLDDSTTTGDGH